MSNSFFGYFEGKDSGKGFGYGYGEGGCGDGSSSSDGHGDGYGYKKTRQKIELNILSHIPDEDLPLYLGAWEFEGTKALFEKKLKDN